MQYPSRAAGRLMCLALLTTVLLTPPPVEAQISTATIQGRVTDNTGVLPGAS